jgi:galactokinase
MSGSQKLHIKAPGRVNLIGGHSDYAGGLVLPMAIDLHTALIGARGHERVVLVSKDEDEAAEVPLDVTDPGRVEPKWARYVAGVVAELQPATGFVGQVGTTIPIGTGLSSSAALEVAVALALLGPDDGGRDRMDIALACQRAEHRASGVPCGVMDQLASLCGVDGHAILIDCTAMTITPVAVPDDAAIIVIDSGERRNLSEVGYSGRRDEVARAAELIGPLPEATLDDVESIDDEVVRKRARHVVTEQQRVRDFVAAITGGDLVSAGEIMTASHDSLRDNQEVTTAALDSLVDTLVSLPGVHGARLTGGGWGGCVVALTDPGALEVGWNVRPSAGATVEQL